MSAEDVKGMISKPDAGKVFRPVNEGDYSGMVEKVFADYSSTPPRGYPTGEFYRPLTEEDGPPTEDEEDVIVYDPADFTPHRYRRVTGIGSCIFPKPLEPDPPAG